jgi:hypothetical protein
MRFKDIENYLKFFVKSIESEKELALERSARYEDEIFRNIARYDAEISFLEIHSHALLIFMHANFERMFCFVACSLSAGKDNGIGTQPPEEFKTSKEFLERLFATRKSFKTPEWKMVDNWRRVRNHLAHGGWDNIVGSKQEGLLAAVRRINEKFKGVLDITESGGRFMIEPNENTARIAMGCYKDFLMLLVENAMYNSSTPHSSGRRHAGE